MKIFNTIGHVFAWIIGVLIPKAETVATDVSAVLGSEATNALLTLAGAQAWQPKINSVVGAIVAKLVIAAKDGKDFSAAIEAYGLNAALDAVALSDLKEIFDAIQNTFKGSNVAVPVKIG